MKLTRVELALIQTALASYAKTEADAHVFHGAKVPADVGVARELRNRIQSHLLSDEPTPTLKVETDLVAQHVAVIDSNTCIVVTCHDFDHYKRLPAVVSYKGVKCGKTGWSSDTNRCHYQSNAIILQVGA